MTDINKKPEQLQVSIPGTVIKEDGKKKSYTTYRIAIGKDDVVEWFVERRYSDFIKLDENIHGEYPNHNLPIKLPPKKMLNSLNPEVVDVRKVGLEKYLAQMVNALPGSEVLVRFLSENMIIPGHDSSKTNAEGVMSGYLKKRGRRTKQFKSRWFVLTGFSLDYYHSKSDALPAGSFPLLAATVKKVESTLSKYAFELRLPTSNHVLLAESEIERDNWVRKIAAHADMLAPATWEADSAFSTNQPYQPKIELTETEALRKENADLKRKLAMVEEEARHYSKLLGIHNIDPNEGLSDDEAPKQDEVDDLDDADLDDTPKLESNNLNIAALARAIDNKRQSMVLSAPSKM